MCDDNFSWQLFLSIIDRYMVRHSKLCIYFLTSFRFLQRRIGCPQVGLDTDLGAVTCSLYLKRSLMKIYVVLTAFRRTLFPHWYSNIVHPWARCLLNKWKIMVSNNHILPLKAPSPLPANGVDIVTFKVWRNTLIAHIQQDVNHHYFMDGGLYSEWQAAEFGRRISQLHDDDPDKLSVCWSVRQSV